VCAKLYILTIFETIV